MWFLFREATKQAAGDILEKTFSLGSWPTKICGDASGSSFCAELLKDTNGLNTGTACTTPTDNNSCQSPTLYTAGSGQVWLDHGAGRSRIKKAQQVCHKIVL
jgi:hypothetical protein